MVNERPDAIIDVVDATNIERNLFLATQLVELGIPVVLALNMMDVVRKNNDFIDIKMLEEKLGCKVVEISALKNENIDKLIETAKEAAHKKNTHYHEFDPDIEKYIKEIEGFSVIKDNPAKRWLAVKFFEEDEKIIEEYPLYGKETRRLNEIIEEAEEKYDDDGEGIITDGRYNFVSEVTKLSLIHI